MMELTIIADAQTAEIGEHTEILLSGKSVAARVVGGKHLDNATIASLHDRGLLPRASDVYPCVRPIGPIEAAIRAQLDIPRAALTADDLARVTELSLRGTPVSDVSALAKLTSLEVLDVANTQVADVSALAGLTNLTHLYLYGTPVVDVTPLGGLTNLTELSLRDTTVVDVTPLAGLTNLTWLDVAGTPVVDVTPLAGLTNLTIYDR